MPTFSFFSNVLFTFVCACIMSISSSQRTAFGSHFSPSTLSGFWESNSGCQAWHSGSCGLRFTRSTISQHTLLPCCSLKVKNWKKVSHWHQTTAWEEIRIIIFQCSHSKCHYNCSGNSKHSTIREKQQSCGQLPCDRSCPQQRRVPAPVRIQSASLVLTKLTPGKWLCPKAKDSSFKSQGLSVHITT